MNCNHIARARRKHKQCRFASAFVSICVHVGRGSESLGMCPEGLGSLLLAGTATASDPLLPITRYTTWAPQGMLGDNVGAD